MTSTKSLPPDALLSHPHQLLAQHIQDVQRAAEAILERHSHDSFLRSPAFHDLVLLACQLHDAGKAHSEFQRYIRAPKDYRGQPKEKAHTPLSLLLSLLFFAKRSLHPLHLFALSQTILNHHGALLTLEELLAKVDDDAWRAQLRKQVQTLDLTALSEATSLPLSDLAPALASLSFRKLKKLLRTAQEAIEDLSLDEAFVARLKVQALFSILLEADKALLAIQREEDYFAHEQQPLPMVLLDATLAQLPPTPLNQQREQARLSVLSCVARAAARQRIFSLTLPTGFGKTLTAASWALKLREAAKECLPKIIVVLPYLTITEQTERVWRSLIGTERQGAMLLAYHSLAAREYVDIDGDEGGSEFLLDTWRADVIITTYDQLLLALMSPKGRHQLRMHQLCDALLILDELQTVPCALWEPLSRQLTALAEHGNTRILAMSATLPPLLPNAQPLLRKDLQTTLFSNFNRYRLQLEHQTPRTLETFADELCEHAAPWTATKARVLVTLNTRATARYIRDQLAEVWSGPLYLLTADVTPKDRLEAVAQIQRGKPCLVVSTQCIEAGVDIDMDLIIRDFAPLDSLIQVAGRCNRHQHRSQATVTIVHLVDEHGKSFAARIYDPVHLDATRRALDGHETIEERDIQNICQDYFDMLVERKDTGYQTAEDFARWRTHINVREALRGPQGEQVSFLVIERAPRLKEKLQKAQNKADRWERRRAFKQLAREIAEVTVSTYLPKGMEPGEIATAFGYLWLLQPGYYTIERGLELPTLEAHDATFSF